MGNDVMMTVSISSEMAGELDKLAAASGQKRSDCVRSLISEGLLRRSEGPYVPLVARAVRREMGAWLRLALLESGKVLSGECLDDAVRLERLAKHLAKEGV